MENITTTTIEILSSTSKSLPPAKYTIIGVDIDTDGYLLMNGIVQHALYTPTSEVQYFTPHIQINPANQRIQIIEIANFFMFKIMRYIEVSDKSEFEFWILIEFLSWIEIIKKAEKSNGIILFHHQERGFVPFLQSEFQNKINIKKKYIITVISDTI